MNTNSALMLFSKVTRLWVLIICCYSFGVSAQNYGLRWQGMVRTGYLKQGIVQTSEVPSSQQYNDCIFFKGDSLEGFDLNKRIEALSQRERIYDEFLFFMYREQVDFIKNKFHIRELPWERKNQKHEHQADKLIEKVNAPCNNLDFETGDFTGWTGGWGYNANSYSLLNLTNNGINTLGLNSPVSSCGFHTLVNSAYGNDPAGNFPGASSGGNYSLRLGVVG